MVWFALFCGVIDAAPETGNDIRLLPEMEQVDRWPSAAGKDFAADRERVLAAWKDLGIAVRKTKIIVTIRGQVLE